ncbi:MAG: hypothetical protein GY935_02355, partial [Gammaproteobacteria bacterium]|nr:hypothetical protein [Gammaproteobacteria bacterium]
DRDGDGVDDSLDAFPDDPDEWADLDGDGIGDNTDTDRDGDGISNDYETQAGFDPNDASSTPSDLDTDGIPDSLDSDRDGDGVDNAQDSFPDDASESSDLDGDSIGDNSDTDRDGDGISNDYETQAGFDPNDAGSTPPDADGDSIPDSLDTDRDGDGVDNDIDSFPDDPTETHDIDGDGIGNNADIDRDGDGVDNAEDAFPDDNTEAYDLDNDGIGDNVDTDRDGDGILNDDDYFPDDPQAFSVPTVNITSPDTLVTLGATPVTIEGTINDPDAILTVNGTPVAHANGTFTAAVGLEEGSNTIIVRAVDTLNHEGTATITVSLDQTAPYITVESHQDGDTVYQDSITVSGLVNDIVRGTVSENEAQVTVNGVTASVANRSYLAEGIALGVGANTINIVASDAVGNVGSESITLTYAVPQNNIISAIGGQAQSGAIRSQLTDPLAVRLVSNGSPAVNQTVVFRVIQGNGIFPSVSDSANSAVMTTDSNGEASIDFQLGSRSGNGNNQVRATAVGYEGQALFYASANAGAATRIGVIDGYNQRGAVRQPLPDPLTVAVTDGGANLIPNAEVIFTVTEGSGRFSNGEATVTVFTDTDGRASARYTLGPEQGLDVQRIIASLVNTAATAGFTASAFMPGDSGQTSISGVVVDNQDQPLANVTVRIEGSTRQTVSDAAGQFIITEAPVGPVHLLVDGSTTSRAGEWPSLSYNLVTVPGVENPLSGPVYLVELDAANAVAVGAQDAVVTHPDLPGFELEVAAGSVTFPDGSKTGSLSITTVNANKVPMPPPNGVQPQLIVTIQPHGAAFDPPAPITVPNTDGLAPLSEIEMFSYDHDLEEFVTIGLGAVSKDGLTVTSKTGSGVVKAGWFAAPTPPDDDGPTGPGPTPDDNPDPDPDEEEEEEEEDPCDKGCPVWSVAKKSLNLVVKDSPLWYSSPVGPNVSIRLVHKSKSIAHNGTYEFRNTDPVLRAFVEDSELFGNRWNFKYTSGILITATEAIVLMPSGKTEAYNLNGSSPGELPAVNKDALHRLYRDSVEQYRLVKRNGVVMEYGFAQSISKIYLSRYTDINGDSLEFGYNANGLLDSITDALGRVTTLEYATLAANVERVNKITDPFGRTALFGYDAALNLTDITDMGNYKSTLTYDDNLNITSITRPQFGTWLFDIEPMDSDKLEVVGRSQVGNSIQTIYGNPYPAPGSNMRLNERITITDPNSNKTEYYYDGAENQTWVVLPNHYSEYEPSGRLSLSYVPPIAGNEYQPKKVYDIKWSNNGWSNITSVTDEDDNQDNRSYHDTGQLRSKKYQNGRSDFYEYNDDNQRIKKTVAKHTEVVKLYEYEYLTPELQLVTSKTGPSVVAGRRKQTLTDYDANNNVERVTRHGFTVDSNGDAQVVSRQRQMTYNQNNQILSIDGPRTAEADLTSFAYYDCTDPASASCAQLHTVTNALGQVTTFNEYIASGLVSLITTPNGLVNDISYDDLERVIRIVQYPEGNAASARTTSIGYQGAKKHVDTTTLPNGRVVNYVYDDAQRLSEVSDNLGYRITYSYDNTGNRTAKHTYGSNSGSEELQRQVERTFNQINLVTEVNRDGSISSYTLDGYDNVQTRTDPNQNPDTSYQYDELYRLTRLTDALGDATLYEYNVKNLVTKVTAGNNAVTSYRYNDFGERTREESPDRGVINYQYDNAGNITQITDGRGIT